MVSEVTVVLRGSERYLRWMQENGAKVRILGVHSAAGGWVNRLVGEKDYVVTYRDDTPDISSPEGHDGRAANE